MSPQVKNVSVQYGGLCTEGESCGRTAYAHLCEVFKAGGFDFEFRLLLSVLRAPATLVGVELAIDGLLAMHNTIQGEWVDQFPFFSGIQKFLSCTSENRAELRAVLRHPKVTVKKFTTYGFKTKSPLYVATLLRCDPLNSEITTKFNRLRAFVIETAFADITEDGTRELETIIDRYERDDHVARRAELNKRDPYAAVRGLKELASSKGVDSLREACVPPTLEQYRSSWKARTSNLGWSHDHSQVAFYCASSPYVFASRGKRSSSEPIRTAMTQDWFDYNDRLVGYFLDNGADVETQPGEVVFSKAAGDEADDDATQIDEFTGSTVTVLSDGLGQGTGQSVRPGAPKSWMRVEKTFLPWTKDKISQSQLQSDVMSWLKPALSEPETLTTEQLEVDFAFGTVLETGRSFDEIECLAVNPTRQEQFVARVGQNSSWVFPSIRPHLRDVESRTHGCLPIVETVEVPMSRLLSAALAELLKRRGINAGYCYLPNAQLRRRAKARLSEVASSLRVQAIERFAFEQCIQLSGWDVLKASTALGKMHAAIRTSIHYRAVSLAEIQALFTRHASTLWQEAPDPTRAEQVTQAFAVGSPFVLRDDAVSEIVRFLTAAESEVAHLRLRSLSRLRGHRDLWNRYVISVVWHQHFAAGLRATGDCYIGSNRIDAATGLATVSDKSNEAGYKRRLVWFPPDVVDRTRRCEERCAMLKERVVHEHDEIDGLFLLSEVCQPIAICASRIEEVVAECLPCPANTPRRWMCNQLAESQLPSEDVSMFMGHWKFFQEQWSAASTFDISQYLDRTRALVPELLAKAGW